MGVGRRKIFGEQLGFWEEKTRIGESIAHRYKASRTADHTSTVAQGWGKAP